MNAAPSCRKKFSLVIMGKCRTCLVYHINKGLRVISRKATDLFTITVTREDRLDQGKKFMWSELAFDQTFTGCGVRSLGRRIGEQSAFAQDQRK